MIHVMININISFLLHRIEEKENKGFIIFISRGQRFQFLIKYIIKEEEEIDLK